MSYVVQTLRSPFFHFSPPMRLYFHLQLVTESTRTFFDIVNDFNQFSSSGLIILPVMALAAATAGLAK